LGINRSSPKPIVTIEAAMLDAILAILLSPFLAWIWFSVSSGILLLFGKGDKNKKGVIIISIRGSPFGGKCSTRCRPWIEGAE